MVGAGLVITGLREAGAVLARGRPVARFVGSWGWRGQTFWRWHGEDVVADLAVANQGPAGSGRGKLPGPTRRRRAVTQTAASVGGLGASGLPGVGARPRPYPALACSLAGQPDWS